MTLTSHVKVTGWLEGLPSGSRAIALSEFVNSLSVAQNVHTELANGDNTIAIPYGTSGKTKGVIISTDPTGTTVKTVRTTGMATGIPILAAAGFFILIFPDPPPASVIINSVGAEVGKITELLFF